MVLMDKMKEHSCAIQPAFGGFNALNFAFMFEQILNADVDLLGTPTDDEESIEPPIIYIPAAIPNQQITAGTVGNAFQLGFTTNNQVSQDTGTVDQQTQLSVAEIVANAVQQHIVAHHPLQDVAGIVVNESNYIHQPQQSIAELVANAVQQQLTDDPLPLNITGLSASIHFQILDADGPNNFSLPIVSPLDAAASNQSQGNTAGLLGNAFQNQVAAANSAVLFPYQQYMAFHQEAASQSSTNSEFSDPSTEIISSAIHNNISALPPDEDSNSSILPLIAPVSSPVNLFYEFPASDDEGYAPSVASNIIVIDSAGNSGSVNEDQGKNSDVPNQSS